MPLIDMSVIENLKSLSKDKAFLANVIDVFVKDTPIIVSDIEKAFKNKSAETLRSAVHKYKSSSRQLGATVLGNLCYEVELAAKEYKHTGKEVESKIAQIKTLGNQAISELKIIKANHLKA
jgi:HPt (histidine-containing phosphotransfer) domain-containing protein